MSAIAVIPARYASTRLPGKPLLDQTGKPMVCHVVDQVNKATLITDVIVATDDQRIIDAVQQHGGHAVMTRADHPNGTSRIAEVVKSLNHPVDIVVNVQGDEPLIPPRLVDRVVQCLLESDAPMATVASPFGEDEDAMDPNVVKVVVNQKNCAMYFSRSCIPHDRDGAGHVPLKHVGLYAYRAEFLPAYVNLSPTPAEQLEKLEQLRVLEHGYPIAVAVENVTHQGIDTPEQYDRFVELYNNS